MMNQSSLRSDQHASQSPISVRLWQLTDLMSRFVSHRLSHCYYIEACIPENERLQRSSYSARGYRAKSFPLVRRSTFPRSAQADHLRPAILGLRPL